MTVFSACCSTFPRVTRTVVARFDVLGFGFRVREGRTVFFVDGGVVLVGPS